MHKLIFLLLTLALSVNVLAQQEFPAYTTAVNIFHNCYNSGSPDSLYLIFSREKQENTSLSDTKQWISGLKEKYGDIDSIIFLKQDSTFASYKIKFSKGVRVLTMSLDNTDRIMGFLFRPFDPEEFPDAEVSDDEREPDGKN
jgi:hypothetical protein